MPDKHISIGQALKVGWKAFAGHIGFWIGVGAIVLSLIILIVALSLSLSKISGGEFIANLIAYFIQFMLSIGLIKISLSLAEGKKPSLADLYSGYPLLFKYFATAFLQGLIIMAGLILFIIPGIIWGLKYQYGVYLVIDRKMKPIEALKASAKLTSGVKWELFGFYLLSMVITFLGIFALLVGYLIAVPVIIVATAHIYRQLTSQDDLAEITSATQKTTVAPPPAPATS